MRFSRRGNGTFIKRCKERCGIERTQTSRFISVCQAFGECSTVGQAFDISTLYTLSEPVCPNEARAEAMRLAQGATWLDRVSSSRHTSCLMGLGYLQGRQNERETARQSRPDATLISYGACMDWDTICRHVGGRRKYNRARQLRAEHRLTQVVQLLKEIGFCHGYQSRTAEALRGPMPEARSRSLLTWHS